MKKLIKKIIVWYITFFASLVLKRHKPKIIAVVGSVGKTSTKDMLFAGLSDHIHIRKNQKSLNSEIGTPLTILGLRNPWNSPVGWLKVCLLAPLRSFKSNYPEWLVLELGVDSPGDMDKIIKWIRPIITVITELPLIPAHVGSFNTAEEVRVEKRKIINATSPKGLLILNGDSEFTKSSKQNFAGQIKLFGFNNDCDIRLSQAGIKYLDSEGVSLPSGISMKITIAGQSFDYIYEGVLGIQHMYPVAVTVAVGSHLGIAVDKILESIDNNYKPVPGRMRLLFGKNNSMIIDDSYNSSPVASEAALETLSLINNSGKKIAVLGEMLELGRYSDQAHRNIGLTVKNSKIDNLYTVGDKAEIISDEAKKLGMNERAVEHYSNYKDVSLTVASRLKPGDVVLVKGSQGARMERIVELLIDPGKIDAGALVRQEVEWKKR